MDRYYGEGHEALNDFPPWAFERYLRQAVQGVVSLPLWEDRSSTS